MCDFLLIVSPSIIFKEQETLPLCLSYEESHNEENFKMWVGLAIVTGVGAELSVHIIISVWNRHRKVDCVENAN